MQQTVEDFCKRIRELDTSGGFTLFLFKPKQEVMLSAPQQQMVAVSVRTKGTQSGGAQCNRARLGEVLKGPGCRYCGKVGHYARECRQKQKHELARMPPQINHTQLPLYGSGYANQYQVSWINKRDKKKKIQNMLRGTHRAMSVQMHSELFIFLLAIA